MVGQLVSIGRSDQSENVLHSVGDSSGSPLPMEELGVQLLEEEGSPQSGSYVPSGKPGQYSGHEEAQRSSVPGVVPVSDGR